MSSITSVGGRLELSMQFQNQGIHSAELAGVDMQAALCTEQEEFVGVDLDSRECWYFDPPQLLDIVHSEGHGRPEYLASERMVINKRIKSIGELTRCFPPKIRLMRHVFSLVQSHIAMLTP